MQLLYSYRPPKQTAHRLQYASDQAVDLAYQRVHQKIRKRIAIGGMILIVGVTIGIFALNSSDKGAAASQANAAKLSAAHGPSPVMTTNSTINSIIADSSDYQIGVALQDVSTGQHKSYGMDVPFEAASTGKLITAATYYHDVEAGQVSLSDIIGAYSAQYQLQQMINKSNNESWNLIAGELGIDALTTYASSIHVDYQGEGNTITPASMVSFLSQLYAGKLLNSDDTNQLLSYMQHTNDESLIPPAVPDDITVYHKYGLLDGELHDVAILVKGDKAYTLAIYTKDTDDSSDTDRTNIIQSITKAAVSQLFNEN